MNSLGVYLVAGLFVAGGNVAIAQTAADVDKASNEAKKEQKKKDFASQEKAQQKLSTPGRSLVDNPIDKNAKAADPAKSLSKMTPEEKAELRKEVVKDSKP